MEFYAILIAGIYLTLVAMLASVTRDFLTKIFLKFVPAVLGIWLLYLAALMQLA